MVVSRKRPRKRACNWRIQRAQISLVSHVPLAAYPVPLVSGCRADTMLRVSLLMLASAVHAQFPTRTLGGLTPRAPRSSALLSTQDMFAFWCKAEREKSLLCQQHVRTAKLGALQKQARARRGPRTPHAVRAMHGS